MHAPNPDAKREQARDRKRRQRARENESGWFCRVCVSAVISEALIARNEDALMPRPEAEAASRSRRKVTIDLDVILTAWALHYLAERAKR